jgi:hypothetical protein
MHIIKRVDTYKIRKQALFLFYMHTYLHSKLSAENLRFAQSRSASLRRLRAFETRSV